MGDVPRWEVCRRFLTCLLLTNQRNTDIICDDEQCIHNDFKIKLLDSERKPLALEVSEERTPLRKRKRKSAGGWNMGEIATPISGRRRRDVRAFEDSAPVKPENGSGFKRLRRVSAAS